VAKSNFLTDQFSTIGGLASVAYGSSSLFPTVADQIKQSSKTKALDSQLPSHALLDFLGTRKLIEDIFRSVVIEEYGITENVTDFVDIYVTDVGRFISIATDLFIANVNKNSVYSVAPTKIIADSLEEAGLRFVNPIPLELNLFNFAIKIEKAFIELGYAGEDFVPFVSLLINNPKTKVTQAPPDSIITLDVKGISTKDERGVERIYGTISPQEYYSGVALKEQGSSIKESILQGYVGYPLFSLLGESLLNPDSYNNLQLDFADSSIFGSNLSDGEEAIYNVNLATINLGNN
jgi:hypothetical protein